jgi:hypothetical protein
VVDRRAPAALLVLAIALATAPALAQRAASDAEREYRLGYQALQAGDCTEALVHYRRSLDLSERPRTLFNMAVCEEALGLGADAWRSYHRFLELAEERDAAIVVKARARVAALRAVLSGKVTVESTPPGARVYVAGERQARGVTPLTLVLEPGVHVVRIATDDALPVERAVDVAPDEVEVVSVTLEASASISIVVEPDDATIEPEGGGPPATGRYDGAVAPGRHGFTIHRDGYQPERLEIEARAARSHVERVRLRPVTLALPPPSAASEESITVAFDRPRVSPARRSLAWGLGGAGAAAIIGGGTVGVLALRDVASPVEADHDRGKRRAWIADGLVVAGTAAIVVAWRLARGRSR